MKTPKSIKYKEHLAKAFRFSRNAQSVLVCWKIEKELKIIWNEEERKLLEEAAQLLDDAEKIVGIVFAKRIGEMAVREARGYE